MQSCNNWQLQLNRDTDKCSCIHFCSGNPCLPLLLSGEPIPTVREVQDLRILISLTLKPPLQCTRAASKGQKMLSMIRLSFKHQLTVTRIYKAFVRPQLEYCSYVWSPYLIKDIGLLEKV